MECNLFKTKQIIRTKQQQRKKQQQQQQQQQQRRQSNVIGPWAKLLTWNTVAIKKRSFKKSIKIPATWFWNRLFEYRMVKTCIPFTLGCFVPRLAEICSIGRWKTIFFNYAIISPSSPIGKGRTLIHLYKLEIPSLKDASWRVCNG